MKRRAFLNASLSALAAAAFRPAESFARDGVMPDVPAVTGDRRDIVLTGSQIRELSDALKGRLLLSGDPGYDQARHILNPSFDKHPALIAQVTGVDDVRIAVDFARANSLLVAVKCGGHSSSGQSTCDRGLMIDLSTFRGVKIDPQRKRAFVAGGTLLGQVDHESLLHGLVTPLGTVSHTGVGGLTLGGGFGRTARRFGMSIDNLESVDVVTADGQLRHVSATDNPDLFWAVRGGGGNFGVATQFEFRLHPMQREVVAGRLVFPIAKARDVLKMFAEYAAAAPDELYLDPFMMKPPGGAPASMLLEVCYSGNAAGAERALAPIRKLGQPLNDTIKTIDYEQVQRSGDVSDPRAMAMYLKSGFVSALPQALLDRMVEGFAGDPRRMTGAFFQQCGGACGRVAPGATAFANRNALSNLMVLTAWPTGNDPTEHIQAARRYWSTLEPFVDGFYVNDMALEATAQDVNSNYGSNYPRLAAIKAKYDPTNLFRLNANIKPVKA